MPTFSVPALSNTVFFDGTPLGPNDVCIPMILVVDANGKIASYRGNPVTLQDVVDPEVVGFTVAQGLANYEFNPSGGLASDDASGTLKIYHVISTSAVETTASLSNIVNTFADGFGFSNIGYAANSNIELAALSTLGTSNVYETGSFREITEGDSVYSYILVEDPNGRLTLVNQFVDPVQDYTPPVFASPLVASASNENNFRLDWVITDAGDTAASANTSLYIGLYSNAISPTTQSVINQDHPDHIQTIFVTDAKTQTFEVIGNGTPSGDAPLTPASTYYIYAAAVDSSGNQQPTPSFLSVTTPDQTAPANLGLVTVALGPNASSEIVFGNLNSINDNVGVTGINVLYNTINDSGSATSEAAIVGQDTFTIQGLLESTTYYCWTTATDGVNTAGPTSVVGGQITTELDFFISATSAADTQYTVEWVAVNAGDTVYVSATVGSNAVVAPDSDTKRVTDTVEVLDVLGGASSNMFDTVTVTDENTTLYNFGETTLGELPLTPGTEFKFYGVRDNAISGLSSVVSSSNVTTTGTFQVSGFPNVVVAQTSGALDMSTPIAGVATKKFGNVAVAPNGDVYWTQSDNGTAKIYKSVDGGASFTQVGSGGTIQSSRFMATAIDPTGTYLYIFAANSTQPISGDGYRGGFWRYTLADTTFTLLTAAVDSLSVNDSGNLTTKAIIFDSDNLPILTTGHRFGGGASGQVHSYKWNGSAIQELGSPLSVTTGQANMAQATRIGTDLYMLTFGVGGIKWSTYHYDLTTGTGGSWTEVGAAFAAVSTGNFNGASITHDDDGVLWRSFYDYSGTGMRVQYNNDPLGSGVWTHADPTGFPNQQLDTSYTNINSATMIHISNKLYLTYVALDTTLGGDNSYYTGMATYTKSTGTWTVEDGIIQNNGRYTYSSADSTSLYVVTQDSTQSPAGVVITLGSTKTSSAAQSNITMNWDVPVPNVCSTIIKAYKEDYTASNVVGVTVVSNEFVFDPVLTTVSVGNRYVFDVSDASCAGNSLTITNNPIQKTDIDLSGVSGWDGTKVQTDALDFTAPLANVGTGFTAVAFAGEEFGSYQGYQQRFFVNIKDSSGTLVVGIRVRFDNPAGTNVVRYLGGADILYDPTPYIPGGLVDFYCYIIRFDGTTIYFDILDTSGTSLYSQFTTEAQEVNALLATPTFSLAVREGTNTVGHEYVIRDLATYDAYVDTADLPSIATGVFSAGGTGSSSEFQVTTTGTSGTPDATVLFVPRIESSFYVYSQENGFSYGTGVNPITAAQVFDVHNVYAETSCNDMVFVTGAEITSNVSTIVFGESNYGESALEPGEYYHFYALHKHPRGILTPTVAHFAENTGYYDVVDFGTGITSFSLDFETSPLPSPWVFYDNTVQTAFVPQASPSGSIGVNSFNSLVPASGDTANDTIQATGVALGATFTVETYLRYYTTVGGGNRHVFIIYDETNPSSAIHISRNFTSSLLTWSQNGALPGTAAGSNGNFALNTWYTVRLEVNGAASKLFINDVQQGGDIDLSYWTGTSAATVTLGNPFNHSNPPTVNAIAGPVYFDSFSVTGGGTGTTISTVPLEWSSPSLDNITGSIAIAAYPYMVSSITAEEVYSPSNAFSHAIIDGSKATTTATPVDPALAGTGIAYADPTVTKSANSEARIVVPVATSGTGKWYFEFDAYIVGGDNTWGLVRSDTPVLNGAFGNDANNEVAGGYVNNTTILYNTGGGLVQSGGRPAVTISSLNSYTISIAVDYDVGKVWFGVDGNYGALYDPDSVNAHVTSANIDISGMNYFAIRPYGSGSTVTFKSTYSYTPSGYSELKLENSVTIGLADYVFGSGLYGETELAQNTTYYFYAVARSPAGVLSDVVASADAATAAAIALSFLSASESTATLAVADYPAGNFPIIAAYIDDASACNVLLPTTTVNTPQYTPASTDIRDGVNAYTVATSTVADISSYAVGTGTYGDEPLLPGTEYVFYATSKDGSDVLGVTSERVSGVVTDGYFGLSGFSAQSNFVESKIDLSWSLPAILQGNPTGALSNVSAHILAVKEEYALSNEFTVTVSGSAFEFAPALPTTLTIGDWYKFDVSDVSNANHQLSFSLADGVPNAYNSTLYGTPGTSGAYVEFVPRQSGDLYSFSVEDGFSYGSNYNVQDIVNTSVDVYNGSVVNGVSTIASAVAVPAEIQTTQTLPFTLYYDGSLTTPIASLPAALTGGGTQVASTGATMELTSAGLTLRVGTVFSSLSLNQIIAFQLNGTNIYGMQIYQPNNEIRVWVNNVIVQTNALPGTFASTTEIFYYFVRLDVANQQVIVDIVDNNNVVQASHSQPATLTAGTFFSAREGSDPTRTLHAFDVYNEAVADVTSIGGSVVTFSTSMIFGESSYGDLPLQPGEYYNFYGILEHPNGLVSPYPVHASTNTTWYSLSNFQIDPELSITASNIPLKWTSPDLSAVGGSIVISAYTSEQPSITVDQVLLTGGTPLPSNVAVEFTGMTGAIPANASSVGTNVTTSGTTFTFTGNDTLRWGADAAAVFDSGTGSASFWFQKQSGLDIGYIFELNANTDRYVLWEDAGVLKTRVILNGGAATDQAVTPSTSVTDGTWIHAVIMYDTDTVTLYVNNTFAHNKTSFQFTGITGDNVFSGQGGGPASAPKIDKVRFYNRVLTVQEIQQLYDDTAGTETIIGPDLQAIVDGSVPSTDLSYVFGTGDYGESNLESSTTYYFYAAAVAPSGIVSETVASDTGTTISNSVLLGEYTTQISSTIDPLFTFTMPTKVRVVGEAIASGGFNYETVIYVQGNSTYYGVQPATNIGNLARFKAGGTRDDVSFPITYTTRHKFEYIFDTAGATAEFNYYDLSDTLLYTKAMVLEGPILTAVGSTMVVKFGVYLTSATQYYVQVFSE